MKEFLFRIHSVFYLQLFDKIYNNKKHKTNKLTFFSPLSLVVVKQIHLKYLNWIEKKKNVRKGKKMYSTSLFGKTMKILKIYFKTLRHFMNFSSFAPIYDDEERKNRHICSTCYLFRI